MTTGEIMQPKREMECGGCGKRIRKAFRRYRGEAFCSACYKRLFKPSPCPGCGRMERLYARDPEAVCVKCERTRPCARCGRTGHRLGKMTVYGPVCNACSVYYREPRPCERCGEPSRRLSRYPKYGIHQRICPRCASVLRGTCERCRRNRFLPDAADGRRLCGKCREFGDVLCPECGKPYPAGYGKRCSDCYHGELLDRRVRIAAAGLASETVRNLFGNYASWLRREYGAHKASLTINRHFPFFQDIDERWGSVPDYAALLDYFGAEGLRRRSTAMRFLEEAGIVKKDTRTKMEHAERERINALCGEVPAGSLAERMLGEYKRRLMEEADKGRISLNTARVYLRAAVSLLKEADFAMPGQKDVKRYLRDAPGQRASLFRFVSFLCENHGADIRMPEAGKRDSSRIRSSERRLLSLLRKAGVDASRSDPEILSAALEYYHGVRVGKSQRGSWEVVEREDGVDVVIDGKRYWVPSLAEVAKGRLS